MTMAKTVIHIDVQLAGGSRQVKNRRGTRTRVNLVHPSLSALLTFYPPVTSPPHWVGWLGL